MQIKLTYSLNGIYVNRGRDLPVQFEGVNNTKFLLWMREVEHEGKTVRQLCCDIICDVSPPSRAKDTLLALKENRLLLDDPIQEGLPWGFETEGTIVDVEGNIIQPRHIIPFDLLPSYSRPWFESIYKEISTNFSAFIKQLMWVQNTYGDHKPFSTVGAFWSLDGKEWSRFPQNIKVEFFQLRPIDVSNAARVKMAKIVSNGTDTPIAHDLIREASGLARNAPRSALLIAFSALETGVKLQLIRMLPDALELIEKIPSPPLITLLQEVLPKIIEAKGLASKYFPLGESSKLYLKKWVSQRNQVTHGSKHTVDSAKVEEFIRFVKDILYILDHLEGQEWALEHLESEYWPLTD